VQPTPPELQAPAQLNSQATEPQPEAKQSQVAQSDAAASHDGKVEDNVTDDEEAPRGEAQGVADGNKTPAANGVAADVPPLVSASAEQGEAAGMIGSLAIKAEGASIDDPLSMAAGFRVTTSGPYCPPTAE
jgi:hypothetical protein